ncbi:MAG: hypothetical protein LBV19_09885 [Streptococcaceae bacterium]|jgi:ABC-type ATPase with predicted acetyltransferase domain|nr:hypothetical protein [Streptococcaceae bacterium]
MLTEQEFFDDEAWDDWDVPDDELERLYEQEREKVWATFNSIYAGKLHGVSASTKSYLFEEFKRQYFANQAKADRHEGNTI